MKRADSHALNPRKVDFMEYPISNTLVDSDGLRRAIRREYAEVAGNPGKGFHFHTGRPLAKILGYVDTWVDALPAGAVDSFAGTGNPFSLGEITTGEHVIDIGSGSGFDSLIAARLVGPTGRVVGVDMTPEMLTKARDAAREAGLSQIEFREGYAESLPVSDGWADVVISNGVVNLCPDKSAVFREMYRVLKPRGRIQIADILVQKPVPESAKMEIDLWTG
jgi:SAM-dependent methyltransferase